jgi:hypothetical protein
VVLFASVLSVHLKCLRKREEVAGGWRRLHNEGLHNLYASLNVISVITSRRMSWAGHVARMGDMRNAYTIFVGKLKGRDRKTLA